MKGIAVTITNRKIRKNRLKKEGDLVKYSKRHGWHIDTGIMNEKMRENPKIISEYLVNKSRERVDNRNSATK